MLPEPVSDAAYFYEMSKPLFTAHPPSDTFSQHFYGEVAADFPAVLEAVNNSLRCAVNTNRNSIDLRIDDSLCEGLAGESDEDLRLLQSGFTRLEVPGIRGGMVPRSISNLISFAGTRTSLPIFT